MTSVVAERFKSFGEFWPFYLGEHAKPSTRAFHFLGTLGGVAVFVAALVTRHYWLIPAALVASYGFAWVSHFTIEKNRPATFAYPLWSFLGDWKMLFLAVTGRLPREARALSRWPLQWTLSLSAVLLVRDPSHVAHVGPDGHLERPDRVLAIDAALASASLPFVEIAPRDCGDDELLAVRTRPSTLLSYARPPSTAA